MFNYMTRAAAGDLCLVVLSRFPEAGYMSQPEICSFHVHKHLTDVVLNVGVIDLLLRGDIFKRVFVGGFSRAQESGCIVRNEAGLPSLLHILAWITDDVFIWNESSRKLDQMARRRPHSNWIPPRVVDLNGGIGKITCHQKLTVERRRTVTYSAWAIRGYQ